MLIASQHGSWSEDMNMNMHIIDGVATISTVAASFDLILVEV
jgi:hypothetical protein